MAGNIHLWMILICCFLSAKPILGQNKSIAFVFDTTSSMAAEFNKVKTTMINILNQKKSTKTMSNEKFIFVPFNDPGFGPALTTNDLKSFESALQKINVTGGGDCPEMCLSGINLALDESFPNSNLYIYTDAPAKDKQLLESILNKIRNKKIEVFIILTDGCYKPEDTEVYESITEASSGQIFELKKTQISTVQDYIESTMLLENQVDLGVFVNEASPPGVLGIFNLSVDSSMKSFSISVSGAKPQIEILNPDGDIIDDPSRVKVSIDLDKIKIVNVYNTEPGTWSVKVGSSTKHSVKFTATSVIHIDVGFFKHKFYEISNEPFGGELTHVLVKIIDDDEIIGELEYIEILDVSGNILFKIPIETVKEAYSDNLFVTTEYLLAPNFPIFISIKGFDNLGNPFRRISSTSIAIKVLDSPIEESIFFEKPLIHNLQEVQTFEYGETAVIYCQATGIPEPTITWILPNGTKISTSCNMYIISEITEENEGSYMCKAINSVGQDEGRTKVVAEKHILDQQTGSANLISANIILMITFLNMVLNNIL